MDRILHLQNQHWRLNVATLGAWILDLGVRFRTPAAFGGEDPFTALLLPALAPTGTWQHGGMPLLFPFAGRSYDGGREGTIQVGGRRLPMPIHGFAHLRHWRVVEDLSGQTDPAITLQLAGPCEDFPFRFEIDYSIRLAGPRVEFALTLRHLPPRPEEAGNLDVPLPWAAGFHPYFHAEAILPGMVADDLSHFRAAPTNTLGLTDATQRLSGRYDPHRREWQSAILSCPAPGAIKLRLNQHLSMECDPEFQVVVLWSPEPTRFLCIEPWLREPNSFMGEDLPAEHRSLSLGIGQERSVAWRLALQEA